MWAPTDCWNPLSGAINSKYHLIAGFAKRSSLSEEISAGRRPTTNQHVACTDSSCQYSAEYHVSVWWASPSMEHFGIPGRMGAWASYPAPLKTFSFQVSLLFHGRPWFQLGSNHFSVPSMFSKGRRGCILSFASFQVMLLCSKITKSRSLSENARLCDTALSVRFVL